MSITLNTFGLRSINSESFNAKGARDERDDLIEYLPRSMRDMANTILRINNLVLNILGYIPGIKEISGCIRMGIGGTIILLTLALGSPTAGRGLIIGRWYSEALLTGIAQVSRGALEAFVPMSGLINLSLDGVGTICNLDAEFPNALVYRGDSYYEDEGETRGQTPPYSDPDYPVLLFPLYLA